MPETAYDRARARIAARRGTKPPAKSIGQHALDFGRTSYEGARDLTTGLGKMFMASRGHVPSVMELSSGVLGDIEEFKGAGAGTRTAMAGEYALGIPFRQMGEDWDKGDYGAMAGRPVAALGAMALGARGMKAKPKIAPPPGPRVPAGLLPEHTGPRFIAGERGMVDAFGPNIEDIGPVRPNVAGEPGATVLPRERGQTVNMDPMVRANYGGTGEAVGPRNVRSSAGIDPFKSQQARAFEALVPERYKATDNIQPFEGQPVDQPKPAYYPSRDPGVAPSKLPDLDENFFNRMDDLSKREALVPDIVDPRDPVVSRAKPVQKGKVARLSEKKTTQGEVVKPPPAMAQVKADLKSGTAVGRPYRMLSDADLMTLGTRGDAAAIKEMIGRKRGEYGQYKPGDLDPLPPVRP